MPLMQDGQAARSRVFPQLVRDPLVGIGQCGKLFLFYDGTIRPQPSPETRTDSAVSAVAPKTAQTDW